MRPKFSLGGSIGAQRMPDLRAWTLGVRRVKSGSIFVEISSSTDNLSDSFLAQRFVVLILIHVSHQLGLYSHFIATRSVRILELGHVIPARPILVSDPQASTAERTASLGE